MIDIEKGLVETLHEAINKFNEGVYYTSCNPDIEDTLGDLLDHISDCHLPYREVTAINDALERIAIRPFQRAGSHMFWSYEYIAPKVQKCIECMARNAIHPE